MFRGPSGYPPSPNFVGRAASGSRFGYSPEAQRYALYLEMSQVAGAEPLVERAPRTSKPDPLTFCNNVIGAYDLITGNVAHALLIAMFPKATDITELSADEVQEWTETLSELIELHPYLTYPAARLVIDVGDYWITMSVPETRKAAPPVTGGDPDPASADTSQLDWITKPVAENTPPAATVEQRCDHLAVNMGHQLAICS